MDNYATQLLIHLFATLEELNEQIQLPYSQAKELQGYFLQVREIIFRLNLLDQDLKESIISEWKEILVKNRFILSKAEYLFELQNGNKFINGSLNYYPIYYQTYSTLIKKEVELLNRYIKLETARCLFVGCGPCPMSAINYSLALPQMQIDILDMSLEALGLARTLVEKYHKEEQITILAPSKIEEFKEINRYDLIIMAAMVGETKEEKKTIYETVAEKLPVGKLILSRTVKENTFDILFYSPLPTNELTDFEVLFSEKLDPYLVVSHTLLKKR